MFIDRTLPNSLKLRRSEMFFTVHGDFGMFRSSGAWSLVLVAVPINIRLLRS
jgi:hypothetical protein